MKGADDNVVRAYRSFRHVLANHKTLGWLNYPNMKAMIGMNQL